MFIIQDGSISEPLSYVQNLEVNQKVNGAFTASFTYFYDENDVAYDMISEESIVTIDGFDFKIQRVEEGDYSKTVSTQSVFFDLIDDRQDEIYGGTHTFNEFATFVFKNTGWAFTSDITGYRFIENFGNANIVALVNGLCAAYECEYQIHENNSVHFTSQIGGDYDAQYRYGHNVASATKVVDTTNLKTYIEGYGANGLHIKITSPLASNPKIGIKKADPIYDDRFSVAETFTEYLTSQLNDVPEVFFEMETVELTNKELGERVWLIYEPLNTEFQTRILEQTKTIQNGELVTSKVVLGNMLPQSTEDLFISQKVEIDENKRQTMSRFEQTNEKIELAVERVGEAEASFLITADEIRSEVSSEVTRLDGEIETNNSSISQLSGAIALKAESSVVNALGTRVNTVEFDINAVEGSLTSKVSTTDYNGNTIASLINQTASDVSISASKINMTGYVTISSLGSEGAVTINEGNVYGVSYTVGKGTGSTLVMSAINGSHSIKSSDANGFRIESNGTVSLKSASGLPITFLGFSRVIGNLSVESYDGATPLLSTNHSQSKVVVNGSLEVGSILVGGKSGVPAVFG